MARAAPSVAMATRGGYGLTRLLDRIDWKLLASSVERGTRWVGHSDHDDAAARPVWRTAGSRRAVTWAGPLAAEHFGRTEATEGGVDEVTATAFCEAMGGELEAIGFRTEAGFDGLDVSGTLWGGNLTMLISLLGTPHWPRIKGGVLFVEDVNEHPYRVERHLLQSAPGRRARCPARRACWATSAHWKPSPLDRGYNLKTVVAHLRSVTKTPILTGLPYRPCADHGDAAGRRARHAGHAGPRRLHRLVKPLPGSARSRH